MRAEREQPKPCRRRRRAHTLEKPVHAVAALPWPRFLGTGGECPLARRRASVVDVSSIHKHIFMSRKISPAWLRRCGAYDNSATVETWQSGASGRSEEHTSELQSLMRISYAVFCLKKKIMRTTKHTKTYFQ